MADHIFQPIPISYTGLFADAHFVEAQEFGKSIVGISKTANSITHLLFFGAAASDSKKYQIRYFVGPSKENGLLQELFALMNTGMMPMFSPILSQVAKVFVERAFDAVVKTILNRPNETSKALDVLHDTIIRHDEFVKQVHAGQMADKAWMQDMIGMLANQNRAALREIPAPVGKSVCQIQIGTRQNGPTIDEPIAEVLRARDGLALGDVQEFDVTVEGVFKTNGACRLRIAGEDRIVSGKITDPALDHAGNVYTTALNAGLALHVTAKPTLKGGRLHTLFVSDAKIVR